MASYAACLIISNQMAPFHCIKCSTASSIQLSGRSFQIFGLAEVQLNGGILIYRGLYLHERHRVNPESKENWINKVWLNELSAVFVLKVGSNNADQLCNLGYEIDVIGLVVLI